MELTGTFLNGKVVFDNDHAIPDGTKARVQVVPETTPTNSSIGERLNQLADEFKNASPDLPADLSRNHDHYLYGVSKKPS